VAAGDIDSMDAADAPAPCPISVTRSGSPPNTAISFFTHFSASIISHSPMLPGNTASPVDIKPVDRICLGILIDVFYYRMAQVDN
jgi:hypothetical protein